MKIVRDTPTRILIVDDGWGGPALAELLKLESEFYQVETATHGTEALGKQEARPFDIILSDLVLVGAPDGAALTAILRQRWPQTKVVVFSGKDRGERRIEVLNAGAEIYLEKPVRSRELRHVIQKIITSTRRDHFGGQFRRLAELARTIQASLEFGILADNIVDAAIALGFDRARLYLHDELRETLIGKVARGMDFDFVGYTIPFTAQPVIKNLFAQDRPTVWDEGVLRHIFPDEDPEPWLSELGLDKTQWIDCQLIVGSRRIGTLSVDHRNHSDHPGYLHEDVQVMGVLAGLAAQALNNALLFADQEIANATLMAIVRDAPDAVVTTDLHGTIKLASPSIKRLLGISSERLIGRQAEEFYRDEVDSSEVGRRVAQGMMAALQRGEMVTNRPITLRTPDGDLCPILLSMNLLHDADGREFGTVGFLREPLSVDQQAEPYRSILDGFGMGTILLDLERRVTFVNQKALHLLGRAESLVLGQPFLSLIDEEQRNALEEHFLHLLNDNQVASIELQLIKLSGPSQALRADLHLHRDSSHKVLGFQVALFSSKELTMLIHTGRLMGLGEMLASVAHEINNPLNNIVVGYRNLVEDLEDKALLAAIDTEELFKIKRNTDRIADRVRRLRSFAKREDFHPRPTPVASFVDEALALCQAQLHNAHIKVETAIPDDIPLVHADGTMIQQVLVNLITNAVDALEASKEKKISIVADRAESEILIVFRDSGPGIDALVRDLIFDPFVTTKRAEQGTGLGLAISRSILELHEGSIELIDNWKGGAAFEIRLPRA